MHYIPLSDNATRQLIDATTVFTEFQNVQAQARRYAGSMYWKREGAYEYLVKTRPRQRTQERLGARSEQTERIHAEYTPRKLALESRQASLREALTEAERMNKALKVLQRVDPSFERKQGHNETAINARGFEVDFLRREAIENDPHPFRFSADEDDLWPVQAVRASVLTTARRFQHPVVAASGRMALMHTIAAPAFVEFKRWMAEKAPQRPAAKRRRDLLQAEIVQELLDAKLLMD